VLSFYNQVCIYEYIIIHDMTYTEFKENFLPELSKIKSFNGKIKYAKEHLTQIGSGSGRIVYDIDGEKVLKLAKNPKGIAQNEAEAGAGYYRDTHHIVAVVFDSADDDNWLIAEKAKKVNEKRIVQLTGIPSLNDLFYYLKNFDSQNHGRGILYRQDPNIVEALNNNEFTQDLQNFVADYGQHPGDYGRPSTYGEVLHDGQPSIVLTDYGLNDEVYDTHYDHSKKKNVWRMVEMYNFADGNDDMLGDLPPQDAVDTRQGMWALMPYGVGDGDGVINEKFINFIENNDRYPTRRILPSTPSLTDEFHNVVNNLGEVLEKVVDKKKFYNNLLELQNYLIRGKFYEREPLEKEIMTLDEATPMGMGLDRSYTDMIAKSFSAKMNLGDPQYLGGGGFGIAYQINNNKVLKFTTDKCEVDAGAKTHRAKPKHLIYVDKIYKVIAPEYNKTLFALIEDFIPDRPVEQFNNYIRLVSSLGNDLYGSLLDLLIKGKSKAPDFQGKTLNDYPELAKLILTSNPDANITAEDRQGAYNYMMNLYAVKLDLLNLGIKSYDYVEPKNLGYKDGMMIYFDIGNCRAEEPNIPAEDIITLEEDSTALYSTPNSIGQDNFPVYNNTDDGSPVQPNELPVNIFAEDLEYNHVVGDATQDKFQISERKMSYMPGSQAVEVKKKCRLAGNGSTSTACNQGDVGNLNFKSITEEIDASEAYRDEGALNAMIRGKKDVAIIMSKVFPNFYNIVAENDFGLIPVKQANHNLGMNVVYRKTPRGEANAKRLYEIMMSHGGYVEDKTPEEAREIGKLLDYSDESINSFIQRIYGKIVPQAPEYADYEQLNEQTIKDFEKLIHKDNVSHNLDKFHLYDQDDFRVYAVNGEAVRDNGFDEWVDGGHHYVDADEPKKDQKYAKFIPEDEIWVDDVFMIKPNDLAAILLHERLERFLMKYYGLKYESAHTNFANPAEVVYRKKAKDGFSADVSEKIYDIFAKKFAKKHTMKKKLNESLIREAQLMSLQDLPFKQEVEQLGGKIYSVGGAVRDEFLGKESKDLDVLISGIPMDQLEQVLGKYGRVDAVGKSFGVLKFRPKGGDEIDIAIPRTEKPSGEGGHKGFDVTSDHALPIEKDLERRDFTINAIAKDTEGNIVDPYNGQQDLQNKIIRVVNPEAFSDDPLRMLRAVQFASRFGFTIEPKTMEMIQGTAQRIKEIPAERVLTELDKILNKGNMRVGAQLLKDTGLFQEIFGFDLKQSIIDRTPFEQIKTMGEFIYLLTRLLQNPSAFYKTNLKGDIDTFKEIKALELAFSGADVSNPIMARSIASNMFLTSPKTLESQITPNEIQNASRELLSGKYPKSINDLAVNGNDLMTLGLQGKEVGDALKMMLLKIYSDQVRNNREELLSLVPKKNINEFEYPGLRPSEVKYDINSYIEKYDIWNQGVIHDPSKESVLRFLEDEFPEQVNDERLKKELLWALTDRELLDEEMKNVKYSAVVLDNRSKQRLIERFRNEIPEGWEIIAHHMTINMGGLDSKFAKFNGMDNIELTVNDIAKDDKVIAVGVSGFDSKNAKPHITLAVNRQGGGKPMMSNNLTNWTKLRVPLVITGKVTEVT
jgi:tRNA nucleotidyltransferase/poly(A) polymerase